LDLRLGEDVVADSAIQIFERNQIDTPPDKGGQLVFDGCNFPTWFVAWLKFVKDIHVAVRSEVVAEDRSKEREAADMVALAEVGKSLVVK